MLTKIAQHIFHKETGESILDIVEIKGFGVVNHVFDIRGPENAYILRMNNEMHR